MVRLGTPKPEMSDKYEKEDCTLVMIHKIAEFKSKELVKEKEELNRQLEKIKTAKQSYDNIISLNAEVGRTITQIEKVTTEGRSIEAKINSAKNELSQIQNQIADFKINWARQKMQGS